MLIAGALGMQPKLHYSSGDELLIFKVPNPGFFSIRFFRARLIHIRLADHAFLRTAESSAVVCAFFKRPIILQATTGGDLCGVELVRAISASGILRAAG